MLHQRKKPHLSSSKQPSGWISKIFFFLRIKEFYLCIRYPNPQILHRTEKPHPKYLILKTKMGDTSRKTIKLQGMESLLLKSLHADPIQKTVQSHHIENWMDFLLLILKYVPERQEIFGYSWGTETSVKSSFCDLRLSWCWQLPFHKFPSNLLLPVGIAY